MTLCPPDRDRARSRSCGRQVAAASTLASAAAIQSRPALLRDSYRATAFSSPGHRDAAPALCRATHHGRFPRHESWWRRARGVPRCRICPGRGLGWPRAAKPGHCWRRMPDRGSPRGSPNRSWPGWCPRFSRSTPRRGRARRPGRVRRQSERPPISGAGRASAAIRARPATRARTRPPARSACNPAPGSRAPGSTT